MAVVRCRMTDCVNWDEGYCSAARINIDDDGVCLTYVTIDDPVEAAEQEREWEADAEDISVDDLLGEDDEAGDEELMIRGRRRWEEW